MDYGGGRGRGRGRGRGYRDRSFSPPQRRSPDYGRYGPGPGPGPGRGRGRFHHRDDRCVLARCRRGALASVAPVSMVGIAASAAASAEAELHNVNLLRPGAREACDASLCICMGSETRAHATHRCHLLCRVSVLGAIDCRLMAAISTWTMRGLLQGGLPGPRWPRRPGPPLQRPRQLWQIWRRRRRRRRRRRLWARWLARARHARHARSRLGWIPGQGVTRVPRVRQPAGQPAAAGRQAAVKDNVHQEAHQ